MLPIHRAPGGAHRVYPRFVLLVAKKGRQEALELAEAISAWLNKRGVANTVTENHDELERCLPAYGPSLAIVLGGDGTMISVARRICQDDMVLLGVNFARVGFLTEFSRDAWRQALESILDHGADVSSRMLLDVRLQRGGETLLSTIAVNDIVAGRGNLARLIHLDLHVDDEHIASLRADGLILCTPTGSSAYSYSAGGPLIHPDLDVVGVTPVCSFLTEIKPLVLPADKLILVTVAEDVLDAYLTLDGQSGCPLQAGDRILAAASPRRMLLASFGRDAYFQKLKTKGFIQGAKEC